MREDGDQLLQPREQWHILHSMQGVADLLEQCAEGEGSSDEERKALRLALRAASDALNAATTPFAAKRMDARVRQALHGQRLDQLAA